MHKFLHLADIHLDSIILCRSESLRTKLREELLAGFERAIDCAISENVVAVLIAGDLVDMDNLSYATEQFLRTQFERLNESHIPVIYVSGESDPADKGRAILDSAWPRNVIHLNEGAPKVIELQDINGTPIARVVGIVYDEHNPFDTLENRLPEAKADIPYIGLAYAQILSSKNHDDDKEGSNGLKFDIEHFQNTGYSYWALGYLHRHQKLEGLKNAWYPGNFMGRSYEESGAKGGLLVSMKDDRTFDVEFRSFSPIRWYDFLLTDLEEVTSLDTLYRCAEHVFDDQREDGELLSMQMVRFTLSGMCPIAGELQSETRRAVLEEKLSQHLNVDDVKIRVRQCTPVVDVAAYQDEPHLLAELLEILDGITADPSLIENLAPDPLASHVKESERDEYLSSLLAALDKEAIARLTREETHAH